MNWLAMSLASVVARRITVVCLALLTTACGLFNRDSAPTQSLPLRSVSQLAQVGYGPQAEFRQCAATSCPKRTPKTLLRPASAVMPAPSPPDPLDAGALPVTGPRDPLCRGDGTCPTR
jgi:hypothetical protein